MSTTFKRELILFGGSSLLVAISFLVLFHAHKTEIAFMQKLETSIPHSCKKAIVRGPRGETYTGYLVTLADRAGVQWQLKVKTDHRLAVFCEQQKEGE